MVGVPNMLCRSVLSHLQNVPKVCDSSLTVSEIESLIIGG